MEYRLFKRRVLLIPESWFDDCVISLFNELTDCEIVVEGRKRLCYVAVDDLKDWHSINAEVQLFIHDHLEKLLDRIGIDYARFLQQLDFNDLLVVEGKESNNG